MEQLTGDWIHHSAKQNAALTQKAQPDWQQLSECILLLLTYHFDSRYHFVVQ